MGDVKLIILSCNNDIYQMATSWFDAHLGSFYDFNYFGMMAGHICSKACLQKMLNI